MWIILRVRSGIRWILGILWIVIVIVMHLRIVRRHSSHLALVLVVTLMVRIAWRIILPVLRGFRSCLALVFLSFGVTLLLLWIVVAASSIVVAHVIYISIIYQDPFMFFLVRFVGGIAVEEATLQKLKLLDARVALAFFLLQRTHFS